LGINYPKDGLVQKPMLNQEKAQSASFQDGLYDYGVDDDNLFQEFEPRLNAKPTVETTKTADLGIDEEIQVKKKRTPIAKLDETKYDDQCFFLDKCQC
jgi:hypothetical protein